MENRIMRNCLAMILLLSCNIQSSPPPASLRTNKPVLQRPKYKTLKDILHEKDIWVSWQSKGEGYPVLHFEGDSVNIEFSGQCEYKYHVALSENKILVYWGFSENCISHIGVRKSFGIVSPVMRQPFMALRLINDSILQADYIYKDWVQQFNRQYNGYKYWPEEFKVVRYE